MTWLPVTAATAEVTRTVLAALIARYGPPLVLISNSSGQATATDATWVAKVRPATTGKDIPGHRGEHSWTIVNERNDGNAVAALALRTLRVLVPPGIRQRDDDVLAFRKSETVSKAHVR